MKLIAGFFLCACIATTGVGIVPPAFLNQEDVRGAFLVSRPKEQPKSGTSSARPSRKRPKPKPKPPASDTKKTTAPADGISGQTTPGKNDQKPAPVNAPRIGIGLTLFMRDTNGLAIRTDPSHVFQKGDGVRVLLETNADGYLYIFNTTNNGPAVMLYPNPELDEAGNYLQAHVPFEIPSSLATEERLRWLVFDENAGDERLFFVFSRAPLSGVPLEEDLINFCRATKDACPWRPSTDIWSAIQKEMAQPLKTDKAKGYGVAQTPREQQATSRGLGLAKDDPEPSLIMMASANSATLVTTLDLIHK
jgi:Domain of unknown function (DUF4384)